MTYKGTDNLRAYLREASLPTMINDRFAPSMPPDGHKSHMNTLKVRPESWRRLESIYSLANFRLEEVITAWVDTYIPEHSLGTEDKDPVTGEFLSVPCPEAPMFNIPYHEERRPSDIHRLAPWIDNLALMTVQRIIHLLNPETLKWGFTLADEEDIDQKYFRYFMWSLNQEDARDLDDELAQTIQRSSVVVAYQPPWILSAQDMKEFSKCRSFPVFRAPGHAFPTPLQSEERLWAKIWDLCVSKNTPWFVLTSYNQWTFGMFSKGWTAAFISGVYEYNTYSPTIIECLTFWIASAMRIAKTFRYPKVPEPIHLPPISMTSRSVTDIPTPATSESNWDGKSVDAASSAGVIRSVSPTISVAGLSEAGLEAPAPPVNRQNAYLELVQNWMEETVDSNDMVPVDEPSRRGRHRDTTPGDHSTGLPGNHHHGDWLV